MPDDLDTRETNNYLSPLWSKLFSSRIYFGFLLILLFGIPRFYLVLQANISGSYQAVSFIFMIMWLSPWLFLKKSGRKEIGLKKPKSWLWILLAFPAGVLLCAQVLGVTDFFFPESPGNSFEYISRTYAANMNNMEGVDPMMIFWITAGTSMIFSPIGEEFLYRGVIHHSFVPQYGHRKASIIDSLAFALTHLAHFGIIYAAGGWSFVPLAAGLWVLLMFFVCQVFHWIKVKSGSVFGAVLCHAGFNFTMTYFIFFNYLIP
ncbi:MAG: type II CAAX endopeptidase family protein [Bacteroidota bacterium]